MDLRRDTYKALTTTHSSSLYSIRLSSKLSKSISVKYKKYLGKIKSNYKNKIDPINETKQIKIVEF